MPSPYDALVSDQGPLGNPFEGLPFFGDMAKMLGQQGGGAWEGARQLAVTVANGGVSEANVDPLERIGIEQLARVAELHVAGVLELPTSVSGRAVTVLPVNRTAWVLRTLDAYRPLVERLATALGPSADDLDEDPQAITDPMAGMFAGMMQMLQPMVLSMTAGSMVGHLAQRSFGQYDLPIPRPIAGAAADELLLVVPNLDAFADEWSIAPDDLRLWICVHEITHHAVFGVPHVRARMDDLLTRHVSAFRNDPTALEDRLGAIDLADPSSMAALQEVLGSPEVILGAITSPEQQALRPELEALVAVVVGVADHVLDVVGGQLIGSYPMLTEALRRRRVEAAEGDRFVERLFGLELAQATYDRGATFVDGVVERAGEEGLRRLWTDEQHLPTPAEVDAPGLWLARIDL
jgi:putative hydrolase